MADKELTIRVNVSGGGAGAAVINNITNNFNYFNKTVGGATTIYNKFGNTYRRVTNRIQRLGSSVFGGLRRIFSSLIVQIGALTTAYIGLRAVMRSISEQGQFEDRIRSMAAILTLRTGDFNQSLRMAQGFMQDLAQDAKELPGEFSEFASIARDTAGPLFMLGKGLDDLRALTASTAIAASVLGQNIEQAGDQTSRMLRGVALIRMPMFSLLQSMGLINMKVEEFNRLTAAQRFEVISEAYKAIAGNQDLIVSVANSWTTQTSTLYDNLFGIVGFMGQIGANIKNAILPVLKQMNDWLENNEERVERIANLFSSYVVAGVDMAGNALMAFLGEGEKIDKLVRNIADSLDFVFQITRSLGTAGVHAFYTMQNAITLVYQATLQMTQGFYLASSAMLISIRATQAAVAGTVSTFDRLRRTVNNLAAAGAEKIGATMAADFLRSSESVWKLQTGLVETTLGMTDLSGTTKMVSENLALINAEIDRGFTLTLPSEIDAASEKLRQMFDEAERVMMAIRGGRALPRGAGDGGVGPVPQELTAWDELNERLKAAEGYFAKLGTTISWAWGRLDAFHEGIMQGAVDWTKAMLDFKKRGMDVVMSSLDKFADGMTDAFMGIIEGTKSAADAFKEFAKDLIYMLIRTAIQLLITTMMAVALRAALGDVTAGGTAANAAGQIGAGLGGLAAAQQQAPTMDNGGVMRGPGYFRQGPIQEAHIPIPSGRVPVEIRERGSSRGNAPVYVTVNFNGVQNGKDAARILQSPEFGRSVKAQVENSLASSPRTRSIVRDAARGRG